MWPVNASRICTRSIILALELLLAATASAADFARYRLAADSEVQILVYREGLLAALGHNHVLEPADLQGTVQITDALSAQLQFRLDQMRVDAPEARAAAGDVFRVQPDTDAVAATRRNLLGADGLDAARFPVARLQVVGPVPLIGEQSLDVQVTLYGVTRSYPVSVRFSQLAERWRAEGRLLLNQRDFGIQPFSLFGGALRVRDQVEVRFSLYAAPD